MKYTPPCTQPAKEQAEPSDEMPFPPLNWSCTQCGQQGHLAHHCPDNADQNNKSSKQSISMDLPGLPISTDRTQLIIPAPRCSLCGNSGHLYHQCPDNVDKHTIDSDDEIPEMFKAPRNLYFEAQQKSDSWFLEQGIIGKNWISKPPSGMDQHWSMVDPRKSLFHQARLAMRQDYMDIQVAPVGQRPKLTRKALHQRQPHVSFGDSPTTDGSKTAVPSTVSATGGP